MSTSEQQAGKWGTLELVSAPQIEAGEMTGVHLRYVAGSADRQPAEVGHQTHIDNTVQILTLVSYGRNLIVGVFPNTRH